MDRRLRIDLSDRLTYWFKPAAGNVMDEFGKALQQRALPGSKPPYVLGASACVAFTETPLIVAAKLLVSADAYDIHFAPAGFLVDRDWLFAQGGRPVIYQSEQEAKLLDDRQLYRHVTLDPAKGIDFTWKREWRIATARLELDERHCRPVVPSLEWLLQVGEKRPALLDDGWLKQAVALENFL